MTGKRIIKWSTILIVLVIILILSMIISLTFGSEEIPTDVVFRILFSQIFNLNENFEHNWDNIIWNLRLPGMLMAVLVGIALAAAGTTMQGLFRNPLADPFIIGISSGGAFGAIIGVIIIKSN